MERKRETSDDGSHFSTVSLPCLHPAGRASLSTRSDGSAPAVRSLSCLKAAEIRLLSIRQIQGLGYWKEASSDLPVSLFPVDAVELKT